MHDSGLDAAGGVLVDAQGRTALPGVLAAGDAARPLDPHTGAHRRSEHWEAAARQGAAAARAILGLAPHPAPPEGFWTDQYGVRFQLAGTAAGHDRMVLDGDPAARDFRALFLSGDRPIGGLLAGRPHALPDLRRAIASAGIDHQTKEAA